MADDNPTDKQPIIPPKSAPVDKVGRAVVRGLAGVLPLVGSAIAEAIEYIEPNPEGLDRTRWEGEVTQEVNTLSERVHEINNCFDPSNQILNQPAAHIAKFMVEHCPDGLRRDWLKVSDISAALLNLAESDIREGLGDLENCGLIETFLTTEPTKYKLTQVAYQQLDPQILNWSPMKDARHLAELTLREADGAYADELREATGWLPRRFNPAWNTMLGYIVNGHVRRFSNFGDFGVSCHPSDSDRAGLRRFVATG